MRLPKVEFGHVAWLLRSRRALAQSLLWTGSNLSEVPGEREGGMLESSKIETDSALMQQNPCRRVGEMTVPRILGLGRTPSGVTIEFPSSIAPSIHARLQRAEASPFHLVFHHMPTGATECPLVVG